MVPHFLGIGCRETGESAGKERTQANEAAGGGAAVQAYYFSFV